MLIDLQGNIKLCDFTFSKRLESNKGRTFSLVGTPEYSAPEMLTQQGHNKSVDYWSIGILLYEMLEGKTPFYDKSVLKNFQNIISKKV